MRRKGFTLTEVSIMLLLIGIVVLIFVNVSTKTVRYTQIEYKRLDLAKVRDEIIGHVALYGALPLDSSGKLLIDGRVPRNRYGEIIHIFYNPYSVCEPIPISYVPAYGSVSGAPKDVAFVLYDNDNPHYVNPEAFPGGYIFTHNVNPDTVAQRGTPPVNVLTVSSAELFVKAGCERPLIVPDEVHALRIAASPQTHTVEFKTSTGQGAYWCVELENGLLLNPSDLLVEHSVLQPVLESSGNNCVRGSANPGVSRIQYGADLTMKFTLDPGIHKPGVYRFTIFIGDRYGSDWSAFKNSIMHANTYLLVVN